MKSRRIGIVASLVVLMALGAACHKNVATAPVPGQLNTFDAYAYRVLADAQAAINDFKGSVTSGKVAETPAIKTALNQAIQDYDLAMVTYQAWHAAGGTGATAPVANAITAVQTDISNITVQSGGK